MSSFVKCTSGQVIVPRDKVARAWSKSLPSSYAVKNSWNCNCTSPYAFMSSCLSTKATYLSRLSSPLKYRKLNCFGRVITIFVARIPGERKYIIWIFNEVADGTSGASICMEGVNGVFSINCTAHLCLCILFFLNIVLLRIRCIQAVQDKLQNCSWNKFK